MSDNGKGYQLRGRVLVVGGLETPSENFQKRLIVIAMDAGSYPQQIPVWFVQKNTSLVDKVFVGDEVTVTFDLSCRGEWKGRYYPELRGWKVEKHGAEQAAKDTAPQSEAEKQDLPF